MTQDEMQRELDQMASWAGANVRIVRRVRELQRKWALTPGLAELADDLEVALEDDGQ